MFSMQGMYSMRSPAVKRLMKEAQELREPTEQYHAQPLEDNLFEWHFTIRGPAESDFDGGIYHGRIVLPPEYPMKPPSIIILTPNGRFEIFKKICLSISGHHPESWQPSWSIRTALLAIIGFMPTHGAGAIGSLDYSKEERTRLVKRSLEWKCPTCGKVSDVLKEVTSASQQTTQEAKELATQINFQGEKSLEAPRSPEPTPSSTPKPTPTVISPTPTTSVSMPTSPPLPNQAQFTPPFGQFPFGSPYFPYPFTPASMAGQNVNTGVMGFPRFPPPPPVIPAMFPPGVMPTYGMGGMSPFPNPPFPVPNLSNSMPAQSGRDSSTTANPQQSQETTKTKTKEETVVSQSQNEATDVDKESNVNSSETTTDDRVDDTTQDSEAPLPEPEESRTDFTTTESAGVRQRTTVSHPIVAPYIPPPIGIVGQNAELPRDTNRDSTWRWLSTFLIVVLSLAIGLLLLRRFILSRTWRFYYGF